MRVKGFKIFFYVKTREKLDQEENAYLEQTASYFAAASVARKKVLSYGQRVPLLKTVFFDTDTAVAAKRFRVFDPR